MLHFWCGQSQIIKILIFAGKKSWYVKLTVFFSLPTIKSNIRYKNKKQKKKKQELNND